MKSADTEGVRRGFSRFVGLPMMSIAIALAAAVCNVRHQRKFWADDEHRPDHPLLGEDPEIHGWQPVTEEEATEEARRHRDARDV